VNYSKVNNSAFRLFVYFDISRLFLLFYALSAPILYTSSAKEITGDAMGTAN